MLLGAGDDNVVLDNIMMINHYRDDIDVMKDYLINLGASEVITEEDNSKRDIKSLYQVCLVAIVIFSFWQNCFNSDYIITVGELNLVIFTIIP